MSSSSDGRPVRLSRLPSCSWRRRVRRPLRQAGEELVGVGFELGDGRLDDEGLYAVPAEGCGQIVVGAGLRRELVPGAPPVRGALPRSAAAARAPVRRFPCGRGRLPSPALPPPRSVGSLPASPRAREVFRALPSDPPAASLCWRPLPACWRGYPGPSPARPLSPGSRSSASARLCSSRSYGSSASARSRASRWRHSSYRSREVSSRDLLESTALLVREVFFFYPGLGAEQFGGEGVDLLRGLARVGEVSFEAGPVAFQLPGCRAQLGVPSRRLRTAVMVGAFELRAPALIRVVELPAPTARRLVLGSQVGLTLGAQRLAADGADLFPVVEQVELPSRLLHLLAETFVLGAQVPGSPRWPRRPLERASASSASRSARASRLSPMPASPCSTWEEPLRPGLEIPVASRTGGPGLRRSAAPCGR